MKIKISHQEMLDILSKGLRQGGVGNILKISDVKVSDYTIVQDDWSNSVELTLVPYDSWSDSR